jgi:hypothetical protein
MKIVLDGFKTFAQLDQWVDWYLMSGENIFLDDLAECCPDQDLNLYPRIDKVIESSEGISLFMEGVDM